MLVRALRHCRCFRVRCYDGNDGLPNSARCTPENPVLVAFSRRFTGAVIDALASLDLHYPDVDKAKRGELTAARKALLAAKEPGAE